MNSILAAPTVSIIIPCRNEQDFIIACLESIIENDISLDDVEVLVVDGMSDDRTRELVEKYAENHSCIKLVDNPRKNTPLALNIGVKQSNGRYIAILGSHSRVEKNFIKANIYNMEHGDTDCIGGIIKTSPKNRTRIAQAIAIGLSHPFGVGNAHFRVGVNAPKFVDTVPFGCYRREVFEKIGLFDEELTRNQDDEFNFRLIKNGGKVLLDPEIVSVYYVRDSLLKLWKMYFQYGYFKPLVAKKIGKIVT
ncbi:MAG: glycosyltransferase family 2 protein, partial [Nitrososphaera sp.]